jgi:hypothetical protein
MTTTQKKSILWAANPLEIIDRLPLEIPDYNGALEKRTKRALMLADPGPNGERLRRMEYLLCQRDILHWLKYWCWLYNPWKPVEQQEFPYMPYEFQEELILYLQDCIKRCNDPNTFERENTVIDKCREMAGSWSVYATILHDFLFFNGSYVILSWKREEVDQLGNMDTPFSKLRFLLQRLPAWMLPQGWTWKDCSNVGLLKNPLGGSISAESMVAAAGAGGRVKGAIFDEFGKVKDGTDFVAWRSMSGTTRWRCAISTPEGRNNKFGRLATNEEKEERVLISLNWWKDPVKTQSAKFVGNQLTSPWLEEQRRTLDPQTFASQVMIDYNQSVKGAVFGDWYGPVHQHKGLKPVPGRRITVCLDPGVHFMVSYTQIDHYNRYLILGEQYFEKADIDRVAEAIIAYQNKRFDGWEFEYCGDPAGGSVNTALAKGKSEYLYLLENYGWNVEYNFQGPVRAEWVPQRIRAMRSALTKLCPQLVLFDGQASPMVLVDTEHCPKIHQALTSEYKYKVDIAGNISDQVEGDHPWDDAGDVATYPLVYKKLFVPFDHSRSRGRKPRGMGVQWTSPI